MRSGKDAADLGGIACRWAKRPRDVTKAPQTINTHYKQAKYNNQKQLTTTTHACGVPLQHLGGRSSAVGVGLVTEKPAVICLRRDGHCAASIVASRR
jgi:hypothetical protein